MNKTKGFLSAASMVFAMAFTLSCSSDGGSGGEPSSSSGNEEPSSSSSVPSSSSEVSSSSSVVSNCADFDPEAEVEHYGQMKKQICDEQDGKKYVYVTIGEQTWMAENLNYNAEGSRCYTDNTGGDSQNRCSTYGRLYKWETAKTVCPKGWHLPTQAEWNVMTAYIGGAPTEGKKLKAVSGWDTSHDDGVNGTDEYGFSALPGGLGHSSGGFGEVGYYGYWWSASEGEYASDYAYGRGMYYGSADAGWRGNIKSFLFSVRCMKDDEVGYE